MVNKTFNPLLLIGCLLLIMLSVTQHAEAQNKIQITSFKRLDTDITARITAPLKDQNGEVCALIRIVTTNKNFIFEPDALGIVARENKLGEIWLYVPRGARRISIMHEQYGVLRNYFYPDIIEKAVTYEMEISFGDDTNIISADNNMQLLVMRPEPSTADIYIDDERMPTEKGLFTATMKKGIHTYRVEAPMYATEAGTIDLGNEQKIMSVTLKPRFGYIEIYSLPEEDANVYIGNQLVGKTPYKSDRLPLRDYHVKVEKTQYFPQDTLLAVSSGNTTTYTFKLISTIRPKEPRRVLAMLEAGWHPSQTSFGAMVGMASVNGAYVRFRSDFASLSTDLECDDTGTLTGDVKGIPYYKEGVSKKARMSVTAGYMRRIVKPLYAYIGAGYGNRVLAWETVEGELVKNADHSATGIATEIGAIARLGKLAVSVGCQTINFKYMELSVGVGFFF